MRSSKISQEDGETCCAAEHRDRASSMKTNICIDIDILWILLTCIDVYK